MTRLLFLPSLVFCLLICFADKSIAAPKPKIRVNVRVDNSVGVIINAGKFKRKKRRKNHVLFLQRSTGNGRLSYVASFAAPKRKTRFIDRTPHSGFVSYQAVLVSKSGKSKYSDLSTIYISNSKLPDNKVDDPPPYPTGPAELSPGNTYCTDAKVEEMIDAINDLRAENNLSSLSRDGALHYAAQVHSNVMADNQDLSHDNWSFEIREAGFLGPRIGQNIAKFMTVPSSIIAAYGKSSQGHLENMLKENDTSLGVGCVIDPNGVYWWTHNFGRLN